MRRVNAPVSSIKQYLKLFNGIFELTDAELDVLTEFVRAEIKISNSEDLNINAFSTDVKKSVADRLGKDNFNTLNTYIKRLKDKNAIQPTQQGYDIHPILVPNGDTEIVFDIEA